MLRNPLLVRCFSLASASTEDGGRLGGVRASRALDMYLRNVRSHEAMMDREREEFERGKRHLANMMGVDPHNITQSHIDSAISYLFPSSLSDKKARPVLKPPDEVLPWFKKLSFDNEGRPFGSLFYTLKPNYYSLLSDVGIRTEKVYKREADLAGRKDADLRLPSLGGSAWLSHDKLCTKLGEKITVEMYAQLVSALEHLCSIPGSHSQSAFIHQWRESITTGEGLKLFGPAIPTPAVHGDIKVATSRTRVKTTYADVEVSPGTGRYTVDGQTIDTFVSLQAREILLCPLIVTDNLGRLDVTARTSGSGGESAIPRAVRHALSLCIASLQPQHTEKLRLAGLLTSDPRRRERSKVNQPGARAKWIWKRR